MHPEELASAIQLMASKRLAPFCLQLMPAYTLAPHNERVIEALEAVERGEIKRLIISMPPRHGKSQLVSIYFPAWFLGRNPDKRVILTAHTSDLAEAFSRQSRNCFVDSRWPFPGVALQKTSKSVSEWNLNDARGGLTAAGIGGPITGKGGHLLIVDDPVKNAEEAMSQRTLQSHWDWYTSTLYTRQEEDAAIILCMTRWSEGDLAGRVLDEMDNGGEQWTEIRLPAIAEPGDPLGRTVGDALWPGKFDKETLDMVQRTIGPRDWNALYMQRPVPDEGLYFQRSTFQYFKAHEDAYILPSLTGDYAIPTSSLYKFLTADLAISERTTADYTVIQCWGVGPKGELLLLHQWRDRIDGISIEGIFEEAYTTWRPDAAYIESVGFQSYLIQNLRRRLPTLPIQEIKPDRDKITRALAVAERFRAKMVYFREGAKWLPDLEHELLTFPGGRHDDQVDTTAYAGIVHSRTIHATTNPRAKQRRYTGWVR
jgi:predicted phage terminase large subunit-like protein